MQSNNKKKKSQSKSEQIRSQFKTNLLQVLTLSLILTIYKLREGMFRLYLIIISPM